MTERLKAAAPCVSFSVAAVGEFRVSDVPADQAPLPGTPEHQAVFGNEEFCIRVELGDLIRVENVPVSKLPSAMLKQAGPHQS